MFMVKAKKNGFYNNLYRYSGDKFQIDDESKFSLHWMEKLDKGEAKKAEDDAKAVKQAEEDRKAKHKKDAEDRKAARQGDRDSLKLRNEEVARIKAEKESKDKSKEK